MSGSKKVQRHWNLKFISKYIVKSANLKSNMFWWSLLEGLAALKGLIKTFNWILICNSFFLIFFSTIAILGISYDKAGSFSFRRQQHVLGTEFWGKKSGKVLLTYFSMYIFYFFELTAHFSSYPSYRRQIVSKMKRKTDTT